MGHITNAPAGCGLIKYGSALVPFVNRFPSNTELYRLMTQLIPDNPRMADISYFLHKIFCRN